MKNIVKLIVARFRTRTITRDLVMGLTFIVFLVFMVIGTINYAVTASNMERDLTVRSQILAKKLANILSVPLWNLDVPVIENIADAYYQSENVSGIRIMNEDAKDLYRIETVESNLIFAREPILYGKELIGYVDVAISTNSIREALHNISSAMLLTMLAVILAVVLVTTLLLEKFLNQPLSELLAGIDTVANGSYSSPLAHARQSDVDEIVVRVNAMATQIANRVEALKESEERFRQVITSISDHVYFFEFTESNNGVNRYISPNLELMTGYPAEKLINNWRFWLNVLVYPPDQGIAEFQMNRLRQGKNSEIEYRLVRADRQVIWIRDSARVKQRGAVKQVYGVVSDITERKLVEKALRAETEERKQAEKELRKYQFQLEEMVAERTSELKALNQELESFAYSISHDLRAPLRHITRFCEIILDDYGEQLPSETLPYLQRVREGAYRLNDLIEDLLKFSRLVRQPLERRAIQPAQLVRQVLDELAGEMDGRDIEIKQGHLPECQADAHLLFQVYENLINNAIKYTGKCAKAIIEIGVWETNSDVIYFVRDNGIGFDMVHAGKLFGVFQRLHNENDYPGTGVGLAIVQRIIERHGGRVWAESAPNQGAAFYFTLRE